MEPSEEVNFPEVPRAWLLSVPDRLWAANLQQPEAGVTAQKGQGARVGTAGSDQAPGTRVPSLGLIWEQKLESKVEGPWKMEDTHRECFVSKVVLLFAELIPQPLTPWWVGSATVTLQTQKEGTYSKSRAWTGLLTPEPKRSTSEPPCCGAGRFKWSVTEWTSGMEGGEAERMPVVKICFWFNLIQHF